MAYVAGGRIDARQRLFVAEQQRFVAGVELGGAHFGDAVGMDAAGPHEGHGLADAIGQLLIAMALGRTVDEAEHPLVDVVEVGVAALGEGAQQIERGRRLTVGHLLALRVGRARLGREVHAVDDVAAVGRQLGAGDGFGRLGARLGELAGDAADLDHRLSGAIGQHHRHLEKDAEEVTDVVGAVLGKTLGAIAALQQERFAGGHLGQALLQLARLAGKHQRRVLGDAGLDGGQFGRIGIIGNLLNRQSSPGIGLPRRRHDKSLPLHRSRRAGWSAAPPHKNSGVILKGPGRRHHQWGLAGENLP